MDDRTIYELEKRIQKLEREAVRFRKGQVTATAPLQAKIGASEEVQTASTVSGTNMIENDPVAALSNSTDLLLLGKIVDEPTGVSLTSTTEWLEQSNLTALGTRSAASDLRGYSVAISSDGAYAAVGAPYYDSSTDADRGAVFLFSRVGTAWTLSQTFTAGTTANDLFGHSVAISDDGLIVAAGLPGDASSRGAVIVRRYSGGTWSTTTLTDSGGASGDALGYSVALSSDGTTLIAGALADDVGANTNQGSAVVWTYAAGSWTQQQKLTQTGGAANDNFGQSVALSSDGNTAIVGAYADNVGANADQGSATVFTRSAGTWTQQANLTDSGGAANDLLGSSVALSNDGNTALVGAPTDNVGANADQGSAIVYTRAAGVWTQGSKLTYSAGAAGDSFGYSVAIDGAGTRIAVGQSNDDIGINADRGSVVIYDYSGSVWDETTTLTASTGVARDGFGWSTAISDDGTYVIGGAPYDDVSTYADHGSATVFALTTTTAAGVTVGDGTVTEAKLANNAVTSAKILDGTIGTGDIADDAVTAAKLRDDAATDANRAVTTNHIRDDAVTAAKIATDAVDSAEIKASAVGTAEIADDAVTAAKIATDAVDAAEIKAGAVGTSELADLGVTDGKLAGSISNAKLATNPLARANHTGTQTASTVSDFDTQVRTSRLDQMAAPTANVSFNSKKITSLLDPTSAQDAATKTYVDTTASAGTPDADATTKGKIQLAGDLSGTAASPQIAASAVGTTEIADGSVTAAKVNAEAWTSWTPTWTAVTANPTIGNGTISGAYIQIGKTVHFRFIITMGSTTSYGTGGYRFSLPVAAKTSGRATILFAGMVFDNSTGNYYPGFGLMRDTATEIAGIAATAGGSVFWGGSTNNPITYATSDTISVHGTYDAA